MDVLDEEAEVEVDYLALRSPDLDELPEHSVESVAGRILVAARLRETRLIDNLPLSVGGATQPA
jgi:pantoate--beta-alanine ligase